MAIASDEPLLERLKILVSEPTTDQHVKRKAVELFGSWAFNFRDMNGMERLTLLRGQVPSKVILSRNEINLRNELFRSDRPHQTTNLPVLLPHREGARLLRRNLPDPSNRHRLVRHIRRVSQRIQTNRKHHLNPSTLRKSDISFFKQLLLHNRTLQT